MAEYPDGEAERVEVFVVSRDWQKIPTADRGETERSGLSVI
jgi:hypothetical protein